MINVARRVCVELLCQRDRSLVVLLPECSEHEREPEVDRAAGLLSEPFDQPLDVVESILLHEHVDQLRNGPRVGGSQIDSALKCADYYALVFVDLLGEFGDLGLEKGASPPLGPGVRDFLRILPGLFQVEPALFHLVGRTADPSLEA